MLSLSLVTVLSLFSPAAQAAPYLADATEPVWLGEQKLRELVQIKPGDFNCVDAHIADFGRHQPGLISFYPRKGDTGWWVNKITDYNERVTRIDGFFRVLSEEEKCADFAEELPKSNTSYTFHRKVEGRSGRVDSAGRQAGQLTETVEMEISPKLTLTGTNVWIDWSVPTAAFNPGRRFIDTFGGEYARVESVFRTRALVQGALKCEAVKGRVDLRFTLPESSENNSIVLRRSYADEAACGTALDDLSQALEARGRSWLPTEFSAERLLYTTTRDSELSSCDGVRVERITAEIEGVRFAGMNFITLGTDAKACPVQRL